MSKQIENEDYYLPESLNLKLMSLLVADYGQNAIPLAKGKSIKFYSPPI